MTNTTLDTAATQAPTGDQVSGLFRFATAGSVDDGKSTLVGRLLHDAKVVLADQLDAVAKASADRGFGGGDGTLDLALLTDGLRAEREQGITIDVAYRYFSTGRRSFILADCPGHVQYTRNTVTGASTADAVVVLVDARKGVLEQTRRHLSVTALLRVPHLVVAVNKIDLVDDGGGRFAAIAEDVLRLATALGLPTPHVVPVSALRGDNVVERSALTPWYPGPTLLELLEGLPTGDAEEGLSGDFRLPVQLVVRPQNGVAPGVDPAAYHDYRAYAGQIAAGSVAVGDTVTVATPGQPRRTTRVTGIEVAGTPRPGASAPDSVTLTLADELDVARGDTIGAAGTLPESAGRFDADLCWLSSDALRPGARVLVKHGTAVVRARVTAIAGRVDLEDFTRVPAGTLELNDIGRVSLHLASELPLEPYAQHRRTGSFLVIDPHDGNTLAAGLVASASPPADAGEAA
ncbi:sulfate adenylyltransferase subunit 1 [Zafaria sp. Z1313]|uniref:sulfate adenylyltransferase subunit 1 n=1 Tax=unclassified Zafaria TaxID=2828765 RepID=UPI002E7941A9|nr:GTP-binding protein [Zafaria sp. J156]MEE1620629.1 GTP-binding protein [Zafaria sp. J156]